MKSVQIFSGSSNAPLARRSGRQPAPGCERSYGRYSNDEARVHIESDPVPQRAVIVQSLSRPVDENILEFCLIADAVHRLGVSDITAVIRGWHTANRIRYSVPANHCP